jgi:shikimate dehydrogenase
VLSGQTTVVGLIGDPVAHSLSPALHNAAFAAAGLDWVYVAFPVPTDQGDGAISAMRTLGIAGLSVTMPHKRCAALGVDRLAPSAARLGVINTVWRDRGELVGENTDGPGFVAALRDEAGWDPAGRRCVILGAGGAARAVTYALAAEGATAVVVVARDPVAAASCADLAGAVGRVGPVQEASSADLVVNATPVGMAGHGGGGGAHLPLGLDGGSLGAGQVVADLVYAPRNTVLLDEARRRGALGIGGRGMLVHQAGLQFSLWTGVAAPLDAMTRALS